VTTVVWSPQAVRDVQAIREYVANDSPGYAALVVRRLVASVERLKTFPLSGRVVPERHDDHLREVIVPPFRIVYRVSSGLAEIVTVFRASRQFPEIR
jgi:addiction module RelE/StbE family toxin